MFGNNGAAGGVGSRVMGGTPCILNSFPSWGFGLLGGGPSFC